MFPPVSPSNFLSQRKKRKNDVLRFFRKKVVGTGDACPSLAAKGFPAAMC